MKKMCTSKNMEIVISGGPCSGKTSVVEKFKEKEYFTLPDPARILGRELGIKFSNEITGKRRFEINNLVFEKYLEQEAKIPEKEIIILDTGMPDNIPYYFLYCPGMKIPKRYLKACKNRYNKIFMLTSLDSYETDGVRGESKEEALTIYQMKDKIYKELGYTVISVPLFSKNKNKSINKRVEFIEKQIETLVALDKDSY